MSAEGSRTAPGHQRRPVKDTVGSAGAWGHTATWETSCHTQELSRAPVGGRPCAGERPAARRDASSHVQRWQSGSPHKRGAGGLPEPCGGPGRLPAPAFREGAPLPRSGARGRAGPTQRFPTQVKTQSPGRDSRATNVATPFLFRVRCVNIQHDKICTKFTI